MRDCNFKISINVAFLSLILFLASSCGSLKDLESDELILSKNTLDIQTSDKLVNIGDLKTEISNLIKQKPQKKNVLNPRTYGKSRTFLDEDLTKESTADIEQFLRNRKGFYLASVTYEIVRSGRTANVIYHIFLDPRYYIDTITYTCQDSAIQRLLALNTNSQKIHENAPLDASDFEIEKARIVNLLKNEGYADFNGNFIEFRGDSSKTKVNITVFIYNPVGKIKHTRYTIGDIHVFTEHIPAQEPFYIGQDTVDQRFFYAKSKSFPVDPGNISKVITLKRGEIFRKTDEAKTNRNLSRLSPYRFAVLDPFLYSEADSQYNYNIFLTPYDHKWILDMGANFFYSSISQIGRNLFGFSGNAGITNRNFKNSGTRYTLGLEGIFEFEISDFPSIEANSLSVQLNNSFDIPRVIDIFKITNVLNSLNIIDDSTLETIDENGTTKIEFGLGLTSILDFYILNSYNISWSYDFQPNPRLRYIIKQIGINILDTEIKDRFRIEILDNNPLLAKSFEDNLFTGFFFRELSIFKKTRETRNGSSFAFIGNFELSGLENYFINKMVNVFTSYNDYWRLINLEFAEFFRLELDGRFYIKTRPRASFASRINFALAVPYANQTVVPFVKQYFVGGPNSIRGWQLRELGPGGHSILLKNPNEGQPFFQTGDLRLEFNVEYRFDLFWLLEGALFLDGGNVWLLNEDPNRPGAKISSDFFNQIALGAGWGLRWDFDYFLFRFDFGYKLRNPFPDDPETGKGYWVLTDGRYNGILGNINFAINYPF